MNDEEKIIKEIMNLINEKKYEEAIKLCENVSNKSTNISYLKSLILYKLKKYKNSIKELENIINLDTNNKEAYFLLGFINIDLKKYKEALVYFDKILSYDDIEIYLKLTTLKNKGNILYKKNNKKCILSYNLFLDCLDKNIKKFNLSSYYYIYDILDIKNKIKNKSEYFNNNYDRVIEKIIHNDFEKKNSLKKISLYNYTKIDKNTISTIINDNIWLSNTNSFNDPIDPIIKTKSILNDYQNLLDRIKIACLTTHNDNTLMWSHYADKHKGICIEYDFNSINNYTIKKVLYKNSIMKSNRIVNIFERIEDFKTEKYYIESFIDLFCIKSKEWKYEDEYRIIYDDKEKNENGILKPAIIKNIYFGIKTPEKDKKLIANIIKCKNEINKNTNSIKLYESYLDDNELFKINIKPYEHRNIDK
ncbi:DUF2971 domain-containing protein [Brachyspira pilosicoli]|uniref:DUF2971 domain-containing protein n=1 Tax=Brachyspira pilosicoli TaxID=52584 RepID=UPI002666559A|nr:DUF2971 domain-containing protein [Brachyspira pilosicoli]